MISAELILTLAHLARLGGWAMTVLLAGAALAAIAFGAGDYETAPDRQKAGLALLGLALLVVAIALLMGPMVRRLTEMRARL